MLAYMCKYAPIEIIQSFGVPVAIMEPHVTNFTQADTLMHPNMCSYVKAVLEEFEGSAYEGMLFTTCCDSARRLYDVLCRRYPEKFFFCFDLPRKMNDASVGLYVRQMRKLIEAFGAFSGKAFDAEKLVEMCGREFEMQRRKQELIAEKKLTEKPSDLHICLAGARPGSEIKKLIEDLGAKISLDLTCTGITREFVVDEADVLTSYAKSLLDQIPCMRMSRVEPRKERLRGMNPPVDGLIYHTVKFCDIYSYEYAEMKANEDLPMVKIETDATSQCAGQILTRVEAFLESLRTRKRRAREIDQSFQNGKNNIRGSVAFGSNGGNLVSIGNSCQVCHDGENAGTAFETEGNCRVCYNGSDPQERITREDVAADGLCFGHLEQNASNQTTDTLHSGYQERSGFSWTADVSKSGSQKDANLSNGMAVEKTGRGMALGEKEFYVAQNFANAGKDNCQMYYMGIDSGSTSTNAVIINEKKEIIASAVVRTGAKSGESAERILAEVLSQAGLSKEDLAIIVSTGYGRVSISFADRNVTEISCHGKGAHFLNPNVRTILDIGGQDSKAIRLDENGDVIDFVMNDKCAAGTGRFLEMMARTLEISIDELGPVSLKSKEHVEISSMCSVFAESEVISLIAQNKETADIAKGIHRAIAGKAVSLMKRVGLEKDYMMTGGVAKNPGVVKVLEEMLGAPLYIYENPEIVGALGAALYGLESF